MKSPCPEGNRLPVPSQIAGQHLLYLAQRPAVSKEAMALLANEVLRYIRDTGMDAAEIDLLGERSQEERLSAEAVQAREQLVHELGWQNMPSHSRAVLFCEWAPPHVDSSFAGKAFVSLVLHTGDEPYLVQAFHTRRHTNEDPDPIELTTTSRVLRPGDLMVLDPCTPHMAAPVRSSRDAFLIMLQVEWPDATELERAELVSRFPAADDDQEACTILL